MFPLKLLTRIPLLFNTRWSKTNQRCSILFWNTRWISTTKFHRINTRSCKLPWTNSVFTTFKGCWKKEPISRWKKDLICTITRSIFSFVSKSKLIQIQTKTSRIKKKYWKKSILSCILFSRRKAKGRHQNYLALLPIDCLMKSYIIEEVSFFSIILFFPRNWRLHKTGRFL